MPLILLTGNGVHASTEHITHFPDTEYELVIYKINGRKKFTVTKATSIRVKKDNYDCGEVRIPLSSPQEAAVMALKQGQLKVAKEKANGKVPAFGILFRANNNYYGKRKCFREFARSIYSVYQKRYRAMFSGTIRRKTGYFSTNSNQGGRRQRL